MLILDQTYDVIVFGGGLSGFATARTCAKANLNTLLVERRPVLGWEATWANQLEFQDGHSDVAQTINQQLAKMGGVGNGLIDAPILEMVLDQEVTNCNLNLLYYAQPVGIDAADQYLHAVHIVGKAEQHTLHARAFVDTSDNGLVWQLSGGERQLPPSSARYTLFLNGDVDLAQPITLAGTDQIQAITVRPNIWAGEWYVSFMLNQASPSRCLLAIPEVLTQLHQAIPGSVDMVVTNVSVEPLPTHIFSHKAKTKADFQHPTLKNLFGQGIWHLACPGEATEDSIFATRMDQGERLGQHIVNTFSSLPEPSTAEINRPYVLTPPTYTTEVLVCGGGTAGAIAAIAAAREGAETTILEASTFLGGIGTGGGIHGYYHGIAGGLQDEVDARVQEITPLFGGPKKVQGFHPIAKRVVLQQMADEAGINTIYDTILTGVQMADRNETLPAVSGDASPRQIENVLAIGPQGNAIYKATTIIDSTGDADVAYMAGVPFTFGRDSDNLPHAYSQAAGRLDKAGKLRILNFDSGYCDPGDMVDLTRARRLGLHHLRHDTFTQENRWVYIAPFIGLRSSRQIQGDYRLSLADQIATRQFPDVIGYARSHYDNHAIDIENESDEAMLWVWTMGNWRRQIGSEIPYRCLLPLGIEGLIVACRSISISPDAHHQLRMQRDMQRIGEAAGVAAAMSIQHKTVPRHIQINHLQTKLRETGALGEKSAARLEILRQPSQDRACLLSEDSNSGSELTDLTTARMGDDPRQQAWALYQHGEGGIPALLDAAQDENLGRAFWASASLAMLNRPEATSTLIRAVETRWHDGQESERSAEAWQSAVVLLGRIGANEAVPILTDLLADEALGLNMLIAGIRALGRIGNSSAIDAIELALQRPNLDTKRILKQSSQFSPTVIDDGRWQLDLTAASVLSQLGKTRLDLVEPYLNDERAYVRKHALKIQAQLQSQA
ncbi:MAG: FAD-dependent oxidoreductase [Chloroflexota bacterium]